MIVSIMQPYFFPYIGYLQLIAHSDAFVFLDDVQYIKDRWVNRNRIIGPGGEPVWLTMPVAAAAHTLPINARTYLRDESALRILRKIESAYRKAPHFEAVFPIVRKIMTFPDANVAAFNVDLLQTLAEVMRLKPRLVRSSTMPDLEGLTGQARVIAICERLCATRYVNPIGGTALYSDAVFRAHGMALDFLETAAEPRQGALPHLSILDTMMYESPDALAEILGQYRVTPAELMKP